MQGELSYVRDAVNRSNQEDERLSHGAGGND
jgi:hypothetical protein